MPINPRLLNPSDFYQPPSTGPINGNFGGNVANPGVGSSGGGQWSSGATFSPSVPDDIQSELDRFRQMQARIAANGGYTP